MCQWSESLCRSTEDRTIFTDVIDTNAKGPGRGGPEVPRAPQSKGSIKVLQAKVADAYCLTQVVVLIPGRIEKPEAIISSPFWPYQVNWFVRVIKAISKDIPASPFFLVAKRNRRNIVSSIISPAL